MFPIDEPQAPCADPAALALVDAAFDQPGGPAGDRMRRQLCAGCPLTTACLQQAMLGHEFGIWGGTSPNLRTRHGAPASESYRSHKRRAAAA